MFTQNTDRYPISLIPKADYRVRLFHLHRGNDPSGSERFQFCAPGSKPAHYVTVAECYDRKTEALVCRAVAVCSNRDRPDKSVGSGVALGRLVRKFLTEVVPTDGPVAALNAIRDGMAGKAKAKLRVVAENGQKTV